MLLTQFTQERLALVLYDGRSGSPQHKVPVYAEVVLREVPSEPAPVRCDAMGRLEVFPELGAVVIEAIETRVDRTWFAAHCDELIFSILERLLAATDVEAPVTDDTRAKVREIVAQAAGSLGAPRPEAAAFDQQRIPLGILASDHAGFVSFDLTRIDWLGLVPEHLRDRCAVEIEVYPLLLETMRVPILNQHRVAPDAIVAKLELPMSDDELVPAHALNLPAMQNPGLIDWRLSPGSFAAVPQSLVGADGCEAFTPANFAISEFHIRQVVRLSDRREGDEPAAYVNEYAVSIVPIGHSLGQVLYTLPLAPGESVRLAVIDWRRSDSGTRDEKTTITESLIHDQTRDRTITETVHAALDEWQRGGSVMGGLAGGAGASGQSGATSVVGGGMLSVGGGYATSSGSKDLAAASVQKITDAIHQSSLAQRELTSSVVVQMDQTENQAIETRSFANHNRGHTLTVIYYEVLRHFRVVTELTKRYRAALLPRKDRNFDDENLILNKRFLLEPALLDKTLAGGFDALKRLDMRRKESMRNPVSVAVPINEADLVIKQVKMLFKVGGEESTNAVSMRIHFINGNSYTLRVGGNDNLNGTGLFDDEEAGFELVSDVIGAYVTWGTVSHMEIAKTSGSTSLHLNLIEAYALGDFGSRQLVKHTPGKHYEFEGNDRHSLFTEKPPPALPAPSVKTPEQQVSVEDYHSFIRLREHLRSERTYYSRILDLGTHPDEYATEFEVRPWAPAGKTIDAVAPTPLEILGSKIAFPLTSEEEEDELIAVPKGERLMSLPTRGVFAEAKLGHCNVAEEIDENRFWRWGEHALPFTASEIAAIQPVQPQRGELNLTASDLPPPVVNIQNAPALPDPTGLAAALKVLSTPEIFRDMSAKKEVGALLDDLITGSVSMAQAANRAREIQAKSRSDAQDSGSTGRGGGWDSGGGGRLPGVPGADPWLGEEVPGLGSASLRRDSPREQLNQLQTLKAFNRAGTLTDSEMREIGASYVRANVSPMVAFALDAPIQADDTMLDVAPIHADEVDQTLFTYKHGKFAIFVPITVITAFRDEIGDVKVHLFFSAGENALHDLLVHGVRGASNQSDWVTIAIPGKDGGSVPISEAEILECLRGANITGKPTALRMSGHSRGCDSVMATLRSPGFKGISLIDRIVFLDEAVEHVPKGRPNEGAIQRNRVADAKHLGVPPDRMIAYEVNNRSVNTTTGASAHVPGATYIELPPNCVGAIGLARLIQDAVAMTPAVAAKLDAKPDLKALVGALPLPARGSFTAKGATGHTPIADFCKSHAVEVQAIVAGLTSPSKSALEFVIANNLSGYGSRFSFGIARHHFFVAEIAHELVD